MKQDLVNNYWTKLESEFIVNNDFGFSLFLCVSVTSVTESFPDFSTYPQPTPIIHFAITFLPMTIHPIKICLLNDISKLSQLSG